MPRCLTRLTFLFLLLFPLYAPQALAGAVSHVVWQSGPVSVTALLDRPGTIDIGLFSGPASDTQRRSYFNKGLAPSAVSTFLIRTADGKNILVDTGLGEEAGKTAELPAAFASVGITPADIDFVFLTHMHMDHIGGLVSQGARAFPKAKIYVSGPELAYWAARAEQSPDDSNAELVKNVLSLYGADMQTPFAFNDTLLPGVTALDASGHTPGHTVFLVQSEGKSLLIIGDLLHAAALQFPLPDECAQYDMDAAKAVEARKRVLAMAAEKGIPVAGMHIPFPSTGLVTKNGAGFSFAAVKP